MGNHIHKSDHTVFSTWVDLDEWWEAVFRADIWVEIMSTCTYTYTCIKMKKK